MRARMTGSTVLLLTASKPGELTIPVPDIATQYRIAALVEASERAYRIAIEAAELRRLVFRNGLVAKLWGNGPSTVVSRPPLEEESTNDELMPAQEEDNGRFRPWS